MDWNRGGALDTNRGAIRGPSNLNRTLDVLQAGSDRMGQVYDDASLNLQSVTPAAPDRAAALEAAESDWGDAEFGINEQTGEVQLPDGTIIKGDAPTLMHLATLKSKDGSPLPKLQKRLNKGFRGWRQADLQRVIDDIEPDSDFFGEAWASTKTSLGLGAAAIDAMFGNDDPNNAWVDEQSDLRKEQSIGNVKAGDARWYSSFDAFRSGMGQTVGNVAGAAIAALPAAAAGAVVGGAPGALITAGGALSGGLLAGGEQATQFYEDALAVMQKMSPDTLMDESPMFREVLRENPEMEYDEAMREVAIRGARSAGGAAATLGIVEGMVGGRLAGNFLARMGFNKSLKGNLKEGVDEASRLAKIGRGAARTGALGVGSALEETGETMLGQAAGASATGIGSTNPTDYFDIEEGIAASQSALLFGPFGGRGRTGTTDIKVDPVKVANESAIGGALRDKENFDKPWSQQTELTEETDQIPAQLRRGAVVAQHAATRDARTAPVPPDQREVVAQQIMNVLDQRYSDEQGSWMDKLDLIQTKPEGRHLLAELVEIQRELQADAEAQLTSGEAPAFERGYGQTVGEQEPGQAPAQGVIPMGGVPRLPSQAPNLAPPIEEAPIEEAPLTMERPGPPPVEDPLARPPPSARARTEPNPAQDTLPLANDSGVPMSEDTGGRLALNGRERRMMQQQRQQQLAEESAANPPALGMDDSTRIGAEIDELARGVERMRADVEHHAPGSLLRKNYERSIAAYEENIAALEAQWQEAKEAEQARASDPDVSVTSAGSPAALQRIRRDEQQQLADAGAGPAPINSPEPLEAPTERTPDGRPLGVTPAPLANPEPMSPGEANSRALTQRRRRGGEDALTADQVAAAASAPAQEPTRSLRKPAKKAAKKVPAKKALKKAAKKAAKKAEPPKSLRKPAKKSLKKPKADEEKTEAAPAPKPEPKVEPKVEAPSTLKAEPRTRRERSANDTETLADRALASDTATVEPAAPADVAAKAAQRKPVTVTVRNEARALPTRLALTSGAKGATVDMRVEVVDEEAMLELGADIAKGNLSRQDLEKAKEAHRDFKQLGTLLDIAVAAAESKLEKELEGSPDGDARMAKHKEDHKGTKKSPIVTIPLTIREIRGFIKAVRAEAKAEMANYKPANSVARQLVNTLLPHLSNHMETEIGGKEVLRQIAKWPDSQIEQILRATSSKVAGSTVAKQAMRGATEVIHAIRRAELEAIGTRKPSTKAPLQVEGTETHKLPHVTEHGKIPDEAQGVVNEWIAQFEKGGHTFSAPVHVMSIDDAQVLFPGAFPGKVPNGKFLRQVDKNGKVTGYVLAVNWDALSKKGASIERLAHEYGHLVTTELYARASWSTQRMIDNAYQRWLTSTRGKSAEDIMREQIPGYTRKTNKGDANDMAYATDFWEWSARNAALYLLDPKRPHLSVVEKFFKSIADALRKVYAKVTGTAEPDHAWAEAMDHWIAGTAKVIPMPRSEEVSHDLKDFDGPAEPADPLRERNVAKKARVGLEGVISLLPKRKMTPEAEEVMDDMLGSGQVDLTKQIGLSLMTLRQIERMFRNTPIGPALTGWVRNQQQKAQTANRALEAGARWMARANQLDAKVRAAFERIMYESTHFGIHPDVPFGAVVVRTVERMVDGKLTKVQERLSNEHLLKGSAYVQGVNLKRYNALQAKWEAMLDADGNTADIYRGMRDAFTHLYVQTLDKQIQLIQNSNFTQGVKDAIVANMKEAKATHREGPYFPLMRVGKWIVKVQLPAFFVGKGGKEGGDAFASKREAREEVRNQRTLNPGAKVMVEKLIGEDGYVVRVFQSGVYFFESETAAKKATAEIEAEVRENYDAAGVNYDDVLAAKEPLDGEATVDGLIIQPAMAAVSDYETLKQVSPELLAEIRKMLLEGTMDPEVANTIERLAIESMPENNYRKALLPRQNVFGASKQMLRSYANRFEGASHHYAVVEHGGAINRNWSAMRESRKTFKGAGRVIEVLGANQKAIADRTKDTTANTVLNFITNLSSMFSLAFSPAYVLTNAMQPWTVTAPVLAGLTGAGGKTVGMGKAVQYLKDAYGQAPNFFTKRGIQDFVNETKVMLGKRGDGHTLQDSAQEIFDKFGKTDEEKAMLESLMARGTLDFSWLNAIEDAMRAGNKLSQKWAALQRVGMALPQQVEAMNRVVTALAAYRLAKDEKMFEGNDETSLQDFADDTVADTQLDYSRANRPLYFNKAVPGLLLQFKLYMQGVYMLFGRQAVLAFGKQQKDETDAQYAARRQQGIKTLGYMFATHAAAAGTLGLGPVTFMAKMALLVAASMAGEDDDDQWLTANWKTGEHLFKDMTKDLFGEYGAQVADHGLFALLGTDMTDRLGVPVIYDARFSGGKEGDPAGVGMDNLVLYSMGAPYANARRVWQGANDAIDGEGMKALNALPSGLRAVARSVKWAGEGLVNQNGDTFVPPDQLSWGDLTINALGFAPLKTSTAYSERGNTKDTLARIRARSDELLQKARTGRDVDDEIREFNKSAPKLFRITSEKLRQSKAAKRVRESGKGRSDENAIKAFLQ